MISKPAVDTSSIYGESTLAGVTTMAAAMPTTGKSLKSFFIHRIRYLGYPSAYVTTDLRSRRKNLIFFFFKLL